MSYLDRPDAVHISTRNRSPSRRDVEANNGLYSHSNDLITKHHTVDGSHIPMSDFGVQKQTQTEASGINSHCDIGEEDESIIKEPTNVVQSWKEYVYIC